MLLAGVAPAVMRAGFIAPGRRSYRWTSNLLQERRLAAIHIVFIAPGAALLQVDVEPFVGAAPRRDGCGGFAGHANVVQHVLPGPAQDLENRQPDETRSGCPDGRVLPGSRSGWNYNSVAVRVSAHIVGLRYANPTFESRVPALSCRSD